VLIRKPRTQEEYEDKIKVSLTEVDKMTIIPEQLLFLARFDAQKPIAQNEKKSLAQIVADIIDSHSKAINFKNLQVIFNSQGINNDLAPYYYSHLILDNIVLNAIIYSGKNSQITISLNRNERGLECEIKDEGIGIKRKIWKNYLFLFSVQMPLTTKILLVMALDFP